MIIKSYLTYLKKEEFPPRSFWHYNFTSKGTQNGTFTAVPTNKVTYTSIFRVTRDSFGLRIAVFEGL